MKIIIAILLALSAGIAWADTTITYQGQLQDASGPYTGTPDMVFRLYDSLTGTNQIGTDIELQNVPVTDGLFQAELDFGDAYDGARWLEVVVDGNVLEPRQRIAPAPVAVQALNVPDGEDTLAELDCASGQIPKSDGSTWACAEDEDTTYLPGDGLKLSGTIFDLRTEFTDELYWRHGGNVGTEAGDYLGTADDSPFEIHVHEQRALRIEPSEDPDRSPRIIAGHASNEIQLGPLDAHVSGATISGGGTSSNPNIVSNWYATVGGGLGNEASGSRGTVGGGGFNTASDHYTAVGGGQQNTASGLHATVPGGRRNVAAGELSFAAGNEAKALHDGSFVWSHSDGAPFETTGQDQFLIQADGGVGIGTNNPQDALDVAGIVRTSGGFRLPDGTLLENLDGIEGTDTLTALDCAADEVALFDGSEWICAEVEISDTLAALNCTGDQIARFDGAEWACAEYHDTVYSAGSGLTLSGTEFELDTELTDGRYWRRGGNLGTEPSSDFIGTTDFKPFELHVQSLRALRIEPAGLRDVDNGPNLVGGHLLNEVVEAVHGATIAGGGGRISRDAPASDIEYPNIVTGRYGSIAGGWSNTADEWSTVGGGESNTASGRFSTVPGGQGNSAGGDYSFAAGRVARAEHDATFVWSDNSGDEFASTGENQFLIRAGGGVGIGTGSPQEMLHVAGRVRVGNFASDTSDPVCRTAEGTLASCSDDLDGSDIWEQVGSDAVYEQGNVGIGTSSPSETLHVVGSAVFGHRTNQASGAGSFVAGGDAWISNHAEGDHSFVGGGTSNAASGHRSYVGGGERNTADGAGSFVAGGEDNSASNSSSFVGSGRMNEASGPNSFVGAGRQNTASGANSFIAGGLANTAGGDQSFAVGSRANAEHDRTFVWSDYPFNDFVSTGANQFLIQARGGVGIGTNSPDASLHVAGMTRTEELRVAGTTNTEALHVAGTTRTEVLQIDGADIAEEFPFSEPVAPGTLVSIDPDNPGQLRKTSAEYDRMVAGVVPGGNEFSTGVVLGKGTGNENAAPVALSGRVYVKALGVQAIKPGDFLTSSSKPGYAQVATDSERMSGAIIGKAMTALEVGDEGVVLVLVNLQ